MALSFDDLMAEAKEEAKATGLEFVAKGGTKVLLRPILMLSKTEVKNILALLDKLNAVKSSKDGDQDTEAVIEMFDSVDQVLICAADRKDPMRKSLADLPPKSRMQIFEAWMKAAEVPEASRSAS